MDPGAERALCSSCPARFLRGWGQLRRAGMHRVLIIDDNQAIHEDFKKILVPREHSVALADAKAALFGGPGAAPVHEPKFEVESALQGQAGFECIQRSV